MTLHWHSPNGSGPIAEILEGSLAEAYTNGDARALDGLELTRDMYEELSARAREDGDPWLTLWVELDAYVPLLEAWRTGGPVMLRGEG